MPNHDQISIKIYKKLINMGFNEDFSFQQILLDFKIDKETYFLDYDT
jgi:hypothetical protein